MRHITEAELRDIFKAQSFETFTLTEGVKLTPGGRQFLVDYKIPIIVQGEQAVKKNVSIPATDVKDCIHAHFELIGSIFFRQATELFTINQDLANMIYDIKGCLEYIGFGKDKDDSVPELLRETDRSKVEFSERDSIQVGREMMSAQHGKEIAVLYYLRCELQTFYFDNQDSLSDYQKKCVVHLMNHLSRKINKIGGEV